MERRRVAAPPSRPTVTAGRSLKSPRRARGATRRVSDERIGILGVDHQRRKGGLVNSKQCANRMQFTLTPAPAGAICRIFLCWLVCGMAILARAQAPAII